ncbi:MAG TPA: class I SAM-dependent methyltransferase [Actinomycetota bacterium]|nr:class I SAM-dependent methyltransferase [Actinomycetota bacterium]
MRITGERIVTPEGGFNASWQRHTACYALTERFLGSGLVLDLGCGTGHARGHIARPSFGLDIDHDSLALQDRPTVVADIRAVPFAAASFSSVLCVHAIEHVPDAERVLRETVRVLKPGGTAVFITPNRLTFGRPDEIIDPYHFVEYDAGQLADLCGRFFGKVTPYGVFGSDRYMEFHRSERRQLDALLRLDPLRLRRLIPRRPRQILYDWKLTRARQGTEGGPASEFTLEDFFLRSDGLEDALDVVAVCE